MRGLFLVSGAVGAGVGFLVPGVADALGGGWITWGLAAGAMTLGALVLLKVPALLREDLVAILLGAAFGPLLGLFLAGWVWHGDFYSLRQPMSAALAGLGLPASWTGAMVAGGGAGVLFAVFLGQRWPVLAAAAFGLIPGAMMGSYGTWSAGVWFVAPFVSGFAFMLVGASAALAGAAAQLGKTDPDKVAGPAILGVGLIAGTCVIGVVCGLATLAAQLADYLPADIANFCLHVLSIPDGLANFAGCSGGFVGGLCAGASIGAIVGSFFIAPPVGLLLGGVLGIVDHIAGGALFAELFADWRAGALTGSLIAAFTVACAMDDEVNEADPAPGAASQAIVVGCAAGGLAAWLGHAPIIAVAAGALGGLWAGKVYLEAL